MTQNRYLFTQITLIFSSLVNIIATSLYSFKIYDYIKTVKDDIHVTISDYTIPIVLITISIIFCISFLTLNIFSLIKIKKGENKFKKIIYANFLTSIAIIVFNTIVLGLTRIFGKFNFLHALMFISLILFIFVLPLQDKINEKYEIKEDIKSDLDVEKEKNYSDNKIANTKLDDMDNSLDEYYNNFGKKDNKK